jgi:hypothetical protein
MKILEIGNMHLVNIAIDFRQIKKNEGLVHMGTSDPAF